MEERLLPLVEFDARKQPVIKLEKIEEMLKKEELTKKKVAVISIADKGLETETAFMLLKLFVGYLQWLTGEEEEMAWLGEEIEGTQLNGIFIYSKPYVINEDAADELVILLMIARGAPEDNVWSKLLTLSFLVSSVQIVNISEEIREEDLNSLRLLIEYAQLANNEENRGSKLQRLEFFVNNFDKKKPEEESQPEETTLSGYDKGEAHLYTVLMDAPNYENSEVNLVDEFQNSFRSYKCFKMTDSDDFMTIYEQLRVFVRSIFGEGFHRLEAKIINRHSITCNEFLTVFKAYYDEIFENNSLPKAKQLVEANIAVEEDCTKAYDSIMRTKFSLDPNGLGVYQHLAEEASFQIFATKAKLAAEAVKELTPTVLTQYFKIQFDDYKDSLVNNKISKSIGIFSNV